jgi:hypothetical protein
VLSEQLRVMAEGIEQLIGVYAERTIAFLMEVTPSNGGAGLSFYRWGDRFTEAEGMSGHQNGRLGGEQANGEVCAVGLTQQVFVRQIFTICCCPHSGCQIWSG